MFLPTAAFALLSALPPVIAPAAALAPPEDLALGVEPRRVRRFHALPQARLRRAEPWVDFLSGPGEGWKARFDERTGLPYRAWGPGIPLGSTEDATAVEDALRDLFRAHPALFGGHVEDLVLDRAGYVERTDTWYVTFAQYHRGLPIYGATVEARIRFGRLIMLGVKTYPALPGAPKLALSSHTAYEVAVQEGPVPEADHRRLGADTVWLPRHAGSGLELVPCWQVFTETVEPPGSWVTFVDARTGEILSTHNEVLFVEGTVHGSHDDRNPGGGLVESPLPHASVFSGDVFVNTDADGAFSLDGEEFTTLLSGNYIRVVNQAGESGLLEFTEEDAEDVLLWDTETATQAEIDSYVFLNEVRDWAAGYAPEVSVVQGQVTSNVNISSTCNAYWSGSVNFYQEGNGCNNTARLADVNYHEWGHGFHYYSLEAGTFDSTVSEGIADTCSFLLTGDSRIAPYFYTNGGYIREVESDRVYPDDLVGQTHTDGLILGGAIWDFWGVLQDEYGEEEAFDIVSQVFADAIKAGFTLGEAYDEFVAADDDDGDLSNGTPHQCEIIEGFDPHGLGPAGTGDIVSLEHEPLENQEPDAGPYAVEASLLNQVPQCYSFESTGGEVHYSTDGGTTWESSALSLDEDLLYGEIPEVEDHTVVLYYLSATTDDGDRITLPQGGSINPLSFYVGEMWELYFEDFEVDEGGFTHELLEGEDELGADDWQWGTPLGNGGDPDYAASGDYAWGNDLGRDNWDGQYQNDKHNRLLSPAIEVAPYPDLVVQFRRWLQVEDGFYDQAHVLMDEEVIWANHATEFAIGDEHHEDGLWTYTTLPLEDTALDGEIQLGWEIISDGGLTFGGWNLDDVAVYAPATDRNLLAITDFQATEADGSGGVALSWTNPEHEDLDTVRVVWAADDWPASAEEGAVVYELTSADPGEAVTVTSEEAESGHFVAFASDGAGTWSVGAFEGYNADTSDASEGGAGEDTGEGVAEGDTGGAGEEDLEPLNARPGCGCASASSPSVPPPALGLLLGGLAWGAARRRREERA